MCNQRSKLFFFSLCVSTLTSTLTSETLVLQDAKFGKGANAEHSLPLSTLTCLLPFQAHPWAGGQRQP